MQGCPCKVRQLPSLYLKMTVSLFPGQGKEKPALAFENGAHIY